MKYNSYVISETKTAISLPLTCPPPYKIKGFSRFKKKAFTLAETLITLTIIGVVAALTIPSLVTEYQKHTYVTGLKKMYSNMQNAVKMIPITEGCSPGDYECAGITNPYNYSELFPLLYKQFKDATYLDTNNKSDNDYIRQTSTLSLNSENYIQLSDGSIIFRTSVSGSSIGVDVNGKKGPNIVGRDIFAFLFDPDGHVEPDGVSPFKWQDNCKSEYIKKNQDISQAFDAFTCTARVLEEDAMKY